MIVNGQSLLQYQPIVGMETSKKKEFGVSYGLTEAGYDIRIKQQVEFVYDHRVNEPLIYVNEELTGSRFTLASTVEEFSIPSCLVGVVHDKSTWARKGLSVFNTVIEPGWKGFLTLELVFHGTDRVTIPAGAGIAQVLFHYVSNEAQYAGKYQHQDDNPVAAIMEH